MRVAALTLFLLIGGDVLALNGLLDLLDALGLY